MCTMRSAQMSMYNITVSFCEHFCFLLFRCNFFSYFTICTEWHCLLEKYDPRFKWIWYRFSNYVTVDMQTAWFVVFCPNIFFYLDTLQWSLFILKWGSQDISKDWYLSGTFAAWFIQQHSSHQFRSLIRNVNFTAFIHAWHCIRIFIIS